VDDLPRIMSYFIDYELLENNASLLAGGRLRCEAEGEVDEVFDAEAFGAEVEDRPFGSAQGPVGIIAQGPVGVVYMPVGERSRTTGPL